MRLTCSVKSIKQLGPDIKRVMLGTEARLPCFKAGQYLEIILPSGQPCPFSIANAPGRDDLELHVRPTPGSADSLEVDALLHSNTPFEIDLPKGDCCLDAVPQQRLLLIAASTGITQIKSLLEFLFAQPATERRHAIDLYWGVVTPADLYLSALLDDWAGTCPEFRFVPVLSTADASWRGRTGLVGEAALQDQRRLDDVLVITAGGPNMVYATLDAFVAAGMPEHQMRSDIFGWAPRTG